MDIYRALGLDVPILHLCVRLLARDVETELLPRLAALRERCATVAKRLQQWTEEQCRLYAEEAGQRLLRQNLLAAAVQPMQASAALERDLRRLAVRLGTAGLFTLEGPALVSCTVPELGPRPLAPDLERAVQTGRASWEHWRRRLPEHQLYELWFLLRGSCAFDILNQFIAEWPAALRGDQGPVVEDVPPARAGLPAVTSGALAYHLVYQVGDDLLSAAAPELGTQTLSLFFSAEDLSYSTLRREVMALLEQLAEQPFLRHASFWQRDPWPGETGAAFLLRLRLPSGEVPLRQMGETIIKASSVGRECLLGRGLLLSGQRLF
ncbi:hypothetical protein [Thermogemmatispora sp.]|uniref:hypothetical protein n=1 Tax=Thermogemmatispora sp. TaxID=1968838 RepID=UPI001D1BC803|nr:hypothetical protein [Thermogemmatispora sp.]MBX5451957.1 hypothetical protein [Thermogemmatispora sp.]